MTPISTQPPQLQTIAINKISNTMFPEHEAIATCHSVRVFNLQVSIQQLLISPHNAHILWSQIVAINKISNIIFPKHEAIIIIHRSMGISNPQKFRFRTKISAQPQFLQTKNDENQNFKHPSNTKTMPTKWLLLVIALSRCSQAPSFTLKSKSPCNPNQHNFYRLQIIWINALVTVCSDKHIAWIFAYFSNDWKTSKACIASNKCNFY